MWPPVTCTITTLHPDLVDELKLLPSGTVLINGIAGQERADTFRGLLFQWDGYSYKPSRVASIPSERTDSRRTDGVLGSGFFKRFVVEVDPLGKSVRLHPPTNFQYQGHGEIVPLRFRDDVPVIKTTIVMPGREPIEAELEVDTGCDSGICLGAGFVQKHQLLAAVKSNAGRKNGIGGGVATQNTSLPLLKIGKMEFRNVDADLFSKGSPVDEPQAGHLGMDALHQHKVIFDYSRRRMIIEALPK